ncbi:MAG: hypothetical protein ACOYCD_04015 [Kiritimatiellia bacterium]|jgi:hypothetical protein
MILLPQKNGGNFNVNHLSFGARILPSAISLLLISLLCIFGLTACQHPAEHTLVVSAESVAVEIEKIPVTYGGFAFSGGSAIAYSAHTRPKTAPGLIPALFAQPIHSGDFHAADLSH